MAAGLKRINIFEGKRVLVKVGAVRISPDAEVIILGQAAQLMRCICCNRIDSVHVVTGLAQER